VRDEDGIEWITLTELRARRDAVAVNAARLESMLASMAAGRPVSRRDFEWFKGGCLRYRATGEPLCRALGLRGAPGSHASGHTMLRVTDGDDDEDESSS
jgi:hypothetical protein